MNRDNCIFETDRERCHPNPAESFRGIICLKHLNLIYGLTIDYTIFESESQQHIVGPYLQVSNNWSFQPNTVLFPDKKFFNKVFNTYENEANTQIDDFKYQMNPKIYQFIHDIKNYDKLVQVDDRRYYYNIVKHLCEKEPSTIDDFNVDILHLKTIVQDRLSNLKHKIDNSNNKLLFKNISVDTNNSVLPSDENPEGLMDIDQNFSAFHKFMISNMLMSYHIKPLNNMKAYVASLLPNIVYIKDVGFVVVQEILHPIKLTILGLNKGSMHFYTNKATTKQKVSKDAPPPNAKDYPDYVHLYNFKTNKISGGKLYNPKC